MSRRFGGACLTAAVIIGSFGTAVAQESSSPPPPPQQPTAAQPAAQAPRRWHGALNAGLGLASGAQGQRSHQFDGSLNRQISDGGRFVANLSRQYQKLTFPDEALAADRMSVSVGGDFTVTKHTVAMARSLYLRDQLLYIDHRFEQLAGYGLHLFDPARRYELYLIPGVSVFQQTLSYSDIEDWEVGLGFFQKFVAKITPAWSVEQSFRFRDNVTDVDKSIESVASMNGMFTKHLGMQLQYQYNYETIVPPDYPNYLQIFSAGIRFQF